MSRHILTVPAAFAIAALSLTATYAADHTHNHGTSTSASSAPPAANNSQTVSIAVTQDGFVPAQVSVKVGQPVKLVVTRQVEVTCATSLVMKDFGINQELPLNKAVTVTVTPKKAGEYRFACPHGHLSGVVKAS